MLSNMAVACTLMLMQSYLEWYGLIILPYLIPCALTLAGLFSELKYKTVTYKLATFKCSYENLFT